MTPLIAALAQAGGVLIDKITLTRQRVELKIFIPILFVFLFFMTAVLWPWLGWISIDLFKPYYLILFFAMIIVAIIWNVFYYKGAQAEKIHDFELIVMGQPLVTILLASIFLQGERSWPIVILAIIAGLALIVSHLHREHLTFSPQMWGLIIAVVLMSVELILIDLLLAVFSPVALYAVRTGIIALFFYFYYRPHLKMVAPHHYGLIAISAALGVVQMVTKFYGFEQFGVVYTSLILILAPILVYIISTIWMHERLKARQVLAGLIILGCIVAATVIGR